MVPSEISALSCEATASENSTWPLERTGQIWTRWHYRVLLTSYGGPVPEQRSFTQKLDYSTGDWQ
jgi:hypothetical protein